MRFVFVDGITELSKGASIKGVKVVSFEEGFLTKPYSRSGFLPRTLLMEALAQLASWLIIYSSDFQLQPVIASVKEINLLSDVRMGSTIELECQITAQGDTGAVLQCWGRVNNQEVIRTQDCTVYYVPLAELQDPEEAKAMFKQLTKKLTRPTSP